MFGGILRFRRNDVKNNGDFDLYGLLTNVGIIGLFFYKVHKLQELIFKNGKNR